MLYFDDPTETLRLKENTCCAKCTETTKCAALAGILRTLAVWEDAVPRKFTRNRDDTHRLERARDETRWGSDGGTYCTDRTHSWVGHGCFFTHGKRAPAQTVCSSFRRAAGDFRCTRDSRLVADTGGAGGSSTRTHTHTRASPARPNGVIIPATGAASRRPPRRRSGSPFARRPRSPVRTA